MKCEFCGKTLDKGDLGANTCQGCGEVIDQTQIVELRDYLKIESYKPPDITVPVNKDHPIVPPESEQCVECFADLMDAYLEEWKKGASCHYCGASSPHNTMASSSTDSNSPAMSKMGTIPSYPFIVNSGPSIGKEILLPIGVEIGRKYLREILSEKGYELLLSTISGEHLRLHRMENGSIGVEDLGSKNGTFLNDERVVGPLPKSMECGDFLSLHEFCLTPSTTSFPSVSIHHQQSGVSWKLPLSDIHQKVHLGRLNETKQRMPWYRMAQLQQAKNPNRLDDLDAISRRHFFIELIIEDGGLGIRFWHELGKEPCAVNIGTTAGETQIEQSSTILDDAERRVIPLGSKITVNMRENTFVIMTFESISE